MLVVLTALSVHQLEPSEVFAACPCASKPSRMPRAGPIGVPPDQEQHCAFFSGKKVQKLMAEPDVVLVETAHQGEPAQKPAGLFTNVNEIAGRRAIQVAQARRKHAGQAGGKSKRGCGAEQAGPAMDMGRPKHRLQSRGGGARLGPSKQAQKVRSLCAPTAAAFDTKHDQAAAVAAKELGVCGFLSAPGLKPGHRAGRLTPRACGSIGREGRHDGCVHDKLRSVPQRQAIGDTLFLLGFNDVGIAFAV